MEARNGRRTEMLKVLRFPVAGLGGIAALAFVCGLYGGVIAGIIVDASLVAYGGGLLIWARS